MLGVAAHRTVVEVESLALELEREAMKRHPPSKFLREDMRDERRREHFALVDLLRIRGRYDLGSFVVDGSLLVHGASLHDTHGPAAAVSRVVALPETDALDDAFERRIEDLHPLLGDVQVAEVASPFRLRARGPPASVRTLAAQRIGRRLAGLAELRRELDELRLRLSELDLQLSRVHPFGLREEDATTQQLELRFERLVRPSKLVALGRDRGERGARPRERLGGRRQSIRRRRQCGLQLHDPTKGFFKFLRRRRIDEHDSSVIDAFDSVELLSASCTYLDRTLCAAQ
jgi:hypothetical protein